MNIKNLLIAIFTVILVSACQQKAPEVKTVGGSEDIMEQPNLAANYQKAEFTIEGMTCAMGCAATIQKNLSKIEGIKNAKVDFESKLAYVEYDQDKVNFDLITETVTKTGSGDIYSVTGFKKSKQLNPTYIL